MKNEREMYVRYTLNSTRSSSDKYGPCEVCGEPVGEVFIQTKYRGKAHAGCKFGHKECLLKFRQISNE